MESIGWIAMSLLGAGFIMGFTGFGFAIFAVSLLSFVWPVTRILPFLFVYNLVMNLCLIVQLRGHLGLKRVGPQLFGFVPGMCGGGFLVSCLDDGALKMIVGLTLPAFATWALTVPFRVRPRHRRWAFTAGFFGGVLGAAVAMSGPPVIIYNTLSQPDRFRFKVDLQVFFFFSNLMLAGTYGLLGLFSLELLAWNLYLSPVMLLGFGLGILGCKHVPNRIFNRFCMGLLGIMGLGLLWKGWTIL